MILLLLGDPSCEEGVWKYTTPTTNTTTTKRFRESSTAGAGAVRHVETPAASSSWSAIGPKKRFWSQFLPHCVWTIYISAMNSKVSLEIVRKDPTKQCWIFPKDPNNETDVIFRNGAHQKINLFLPHPSGHDEATESEGRRDEQEMRQRCPPRSLLL